MHERRGGGLERAVLVGAVLVQALLLVGCASAALETPDADVAAQAEGDGGPSRRAEGRPPLFISPAGQPFHGDPGAAPPVTAWFAQADADHDGKLTVAELSTDFETFFRRLDANADGVIDGFEAQAYERQIAPELLPQVGRLRAGEGQDDRLFKGRSAERGRFSRGSRAANAQGGGGVRTAGAYQLFPDLEPITAADTDLDGKVTIKEWRARAKAVFAQLDARQIGYLTLAILPATPQQRELDKRRAALEKRPAR